jgi:hypothetical protein
MTSSAWRERSGPLGTPRPHRLTPPNSLCSASHLRSRSCARRRSLMPKPASPHTRSRGRLRRPANCQRRNYEPARHDGGASNLAVWQLVTVTNLANGRSVQVRLNDRGPFVGEASISATERRARSAWPGRRGCPSNEPSNVKKRLRDRWRAF